MSQTNVYVPRIKNQKPRCSFLAKRKTRIKCLHHVINFRLGVSIVGYWHKQQPIFTFSFQSAVMQSIRNHVTHDIEMKLGWVSSQFLTNSSNRRKRQEKLKELNLINSKNTGENYFLKASNKEMAKITQPLSLRGLFSSMIRFFERSQFCGKQ